jgi:hypothetical protein
MVVNEATTSTGLPHAGRYELAAEEFGSPYVVI